MPDDLAEEAKSGVRTGAGDVDVRVLLLFAEEEPPSLGMSPLCQGGILTERAHTLSEWRQRTFRSPDVVFLDLEAFSIAGEDVISEVRAAFPEAAIVALGSALPGERAAELLCAGIPSLPKPVSTAALTDLALELSRRSVQHRATVPTTPAPITGIVLEAMIESYATHRSLSRQQRAILRLYLGGANDKQIAGSCGCAEATVYEHWRRMGRKAGGSSKADAVTDFHRFLAAC